MRGKKSVLGVKGEEEDCVHRAQYFDLSRVWVRVDLCYLSLRRVFPLMKTSPTILPGGVIKIKYDMNEV